ncbi:MAG: ATPase, T2SS/T4P/T4SS family [Patescibacteria group bacterium]
MEANDQLYMDKLLATISEYKASDLHLVPGNFPILRVDGKLMPLSSEKTITADLIKQLIDAWLNEADKKILARDKNVVMVYSASNKLRFRTGFYYQRETLSASLKIIPKQIPDLTTLGLPNEVQKIVNMREGLIIISGPFGSGKSTTTAAIINAINQTQAKHIITLEKPVEYIYTDTNSIIEQREIGRDASSFISALKFIMDEDIDTVVVSEIEGAEMIKEIFKLVDSGRLVIALMTAETVVKTLNEFISFFAVAERPYMQEKLSVLLSGIVAQKMLPSIAGGQVVACEAFFPDETALAIIKNGEYEKLNNILYSSQTEGVVSFDHSLAELVNSGLITLNVAIEHAEDKQYFQTLINQQPV